MKILYISTFLPDKSSKFPAAGSNVTLSNIQELYRAGNIIDYCALVNNVELKYNKSCENKYLNKIILFKITKLRKIWNILLNPKIPLICSVRYDKRIRNFLKLNQNKYDRIIFDFTQNISYINDVKNKKNNIIIEHDISFQAYERKKEEEKNILKKFLYEFEYKRLKNYEKKMLDKFETVIVLNRKDFNIIKNTGEKIKILQPFYNKFEFERLKENKTFNIGFFGAMNRIENEEAVIFFLEKIWKNICDKNTYFYIIGANPSEKLKKIVLTYKNVVLTGFVKNVGEYFSILNIGVIPLFKGAGIKIKTVEMLYSELPVVSTTVGIEGILVKNEYDYLLAKNETEFFKQILRLKNDKELYENIKSNLKVKKDKLIEGEKIEKLIL